MSDLSPEDIIRRVLWHSETMEHKPGGRDQTSNPTSASAAIPFSVTENTAARELRAFLGCDCGYCSARAKLDALLAERQQDKEQIDQHEKIIVRLMDHNITLKERVRQLVEALEAVDELVDAYERGNSDSNGLSLAHGIARSALAAVSQDRETGADTPGVGTFVGDVAAPTSPDCDECGQPEGAPHLAYCPADPAVVSAAISAGERMDREAEAAVHEPAGDAGQLAHLERMERIEQEVFPDARPRSEVVVRVPAPPPAPDICANPYRQDKQHSWRFDGDDPYIWCGACGTRRDALTGRNLPAPPQETA